MFFIQNKLLCYIKLTLTRKLFFLCLLTFVNPLSSARRYTLFILSSYWEHFQTERGFCTCLFYWLMITELFKFLNYRQFLWFSLSYMWGKVMYIRELYSPFPKMLILFEIIKKFEAGNILENMVCVYYFPTQYSYNLKCRTLNWTSLLFFISLSKIHCIGLDTVCWLLLF